MEFGKVETAELPKINFDLPLDPVSNIEVLSSGKGNTEFFLGCASTKDKLNIYARTANCIELNATYYNLPTKKQIELWKIAVPQGFKYVPKFPQVITHLKRLKGAWNDTLDFLAVLNGLEDKLGPLFLMPHPQMDVNSLDTVREFIGAFPKNKSLYLELRHPDWFKEGYNTDMLSFLRQERRGTVISDSAGRRDAVHMHLSTPECFIRFVGNGLHHTDYVRIDQWIDRLKKWKENGLETCYFFIHQHENKHAAALLAYLKEKL